MVVLSDDKAASRKISAFAASGERWMVAVRMVSEGVGAWSHRTGQSYGVVHAELRRTCGGPPLPQATAGQIRARIDTIRRWAASRR